MSAPIGPGDWVECVDLSPHPSGGGAPTCLTLGKLYLVLDVAPSWYAADRGALVVFVFPPGQMLSNGLIYGGTQPWRFRPIYPGGELKRLLLEKPLEAKPREQVPA